MEKFSAAFVASAAVFFFYLALIRRGTSERNALLLAAALAFATGTWSTSSQELWLHAIAELLCAVALFLLAGPPTRGNAALAGAVIALIACNRPPDLFLAAGFAVAALAWAGRERWFLLAAAVVPPALTLAYNLIVFAHPLGGWGLISAGRFGLSTPWNGIAGLLISPSRGLLVFTPWLLFGIFGIHVAISKNRERFLTLCLLAGVIAHIGFYSINDWRAGWSYGPRYMVDTLPVLAWFVAIGIDDMKIRMRAALIALICYSAAVETIGAYAYRHAADVVLFRDDHFETFGGEPVRIPDFRASWDIRNTYIAELTSNRQPVPSIWKYFWRL
jgi:hypothetical protein